MGRYSVIQQLVDSEPANASKTNSEVAAWCNEAVVVRAVGVPVGRLVNELDNMVDANGVPVWEGIEAGQALENPIGIACKAAVRLRATREDYPPVNVASTMFQGSLTALVAGSLLTQAQADILTDLGCTAISRAEAAGAGLVKGSDIAVIRRQI